MIFKRNKLSFESFVNNKLEALKIAAALREDWKDTETILDVAQSLFDWLIENDKGGSM